MEFTLLKNFHPIAPVIYAFQQLPETFPMCRLLVDASGQMVTPELWDLLWTRRDQELPLSFYRLVLRQYSKIAHQNPSEALLWRFAATTNIRTKRRVMHARRRGAYELSASAHAIHFEAMSWFYLVRRAPRTLLRSCWITIRCASCCRTSIRSLYRRYLDGR